MPRNFTYVLNQLRMDTMAQCTSPTLTSVLEGFAQLGLPVIGDVNNGTAAGAMILPSSMQPDNQTSAHNSSRRVMGVEFAPRNKSKARSISCTREVIVSAGAIFTPTLLQVSGIGPSDVLKSLDILVKIDLPGVGCNLQDHPMVYANYYYRNESYFRSNEIADGVYDEAAEEYIRNRTDDWKQFMNKSSGDCIPSNTPNSVKKGYEFQKKILQDQMLSNDAGTFETMAIS
ncbi:Glucose-methanol-choline oxidoreductase, N-terminal [Fusarium oxysporum f. sp. vasinfectum]|nr:Glucose-methanol-choline oxidoreductase, N-terminal [Fusarium oxysporum f. sp. vasinfectum]